MIGPALVRSGREDLTKSSAFAGRPAFRVQLTELKILHENQTAMKMLFLSGDAGSKSVGDMRLLVTSFAEPQRGGRGPKSGSCAAVTLREN